MLPRASSACVGCVQRARLNPYASQSLPPLRWRSLASCVLAACTPVPLLVAVSPSSSYGMHRAVGTDMVCIAQSACIWYASVPPSVAPSAPCYQLCLRWVRAAGSTQPLCFPAPSSLAPAVARELSARGLHAGASWLHCLPSCFETRSELAESQSRRRALFPKVDTQFKYSFIKVQRRLPFFSHLPKHIRPNARFIHIQLQGCETSSLSNGHPFVGLFRSWRCSSRVLR